MSAYKPPLEGRSSKPYLLLDFNERTTPVGEEIKKALVSYISEDRLQAYPEYGDIVSKLARYAEVSEDEVLFTNGSDQGIDLVYRLTTKAGDEAIVPQPTFAMLTHAAELQDLKIKTPAYSREYGYPLDEVKSLVTESTALIAVCNPNSPTGTLLAPQEIKGLAQFASHAAILVDECYYEFSKSSAKEYLAQCPNIFIARTFSKTWGLPSLRFGYMLSHRDNIAELLKVRGPYDVNKFAVVAASTALDSPRFMEEYVAEVLEKSKPKLLTYLDQKDVEYWPTEANFVLIYAPNATQVLSALEEENILVRPRSGPGIDGTLRITIGTLSDTKRLISVLEKVL